MEMYQKAKKRRAGEGERIRGGRTLSILFFFSLFKLTWSFLDLKEEATCARY